MKTWTARLSARRITAGFVLGALLLASSTALADQRTEAKSHFKRGMGAIAEGKYEEGISELQQAYEILPHPNVLYNIARAYAEEGDLETHRLLQEVPRREPARQRRGLAGRRRARSASRAAAGHRRGGAGLAQTPTRRAARPDGDARHHARHHDAGHDAGAPTGPVAQVPRARRPCAERRRGQDGRRLRRERRHRVEGRAEPPRCAELDVDHHRAGHPPVGHHQDPRAAPPPRRRRHHGGHQRPDRGVAPRVQSEAVQQGARPHRRTKHLRRPPRCDVLAIPVDWRRGHRAHRGGPRPGSALYGADAFNGVINIITKAPGEGKSGFNLAYGNVNQSHGSMWASGPRQGRGVPHQRAASTTSRAGARRSPTAASTSRRAANFVDQDTSAKTVG